MASFAFKQERSRAKGRAERSLSQLNAQPAPRRLQQCLTAALRCGAVARSLGAELFGLQRRVRLLGVQLRARGQVPLPEAGQPVLRVSGREVLTRRPSRVECGRQASDECLHLFFLLLPSRNHFRRRLCTAHVARRCGALWFRGARAQTTAATTATTGARETPHVVGLVLAPLARALELPIVRELLLSRGGRLCEVLVREIAHQDLLAGRDVPHADDAARPLLRRDHSGVWGAGVVRLANRGVDHLEAASRGTCVGIEGQGKHCFNGHLGVLTLRKTPLRPLLVALTVGPRGRADP
mmetsp:Transcript_88622/g.259036  ORF Transcript_88622/g.259036 Transcript_88622/m.259036 type:complete len:296 (+) Transcript_88622:68-955(+)